MADTPVYASEEEALHALTDQYAKAIHAMGQGVPGARERVLKAYQALQQARVSQAATAARRSEPKLR